MHVLYGSRTSEDEYPAIICYISLCFFDSARCVWELGSAVGLCQAEKVVVQKNDVKGGGDNATWDFDGREA